MSNPKTMNFLSSAVFWGAVIILFGMSIILREVFHIHFPVFRVVIGILLIYWGIKMVSGGFGRSWSSNSTVFDHSTIFSNGSQKEYNVVFGHSTIDLFKIENKSGKYEVNSVFSHTNLILNDSIPTLVKMNAAFASVQAPGKVANGFGETSYTTSTYKENDPYVLIEANAVFGKIDIESKRW
jgi:hypothetical protein